MCSTMQMRMRQEEAKRDSPRLFSENELRSIIRSEIRLVIREEVSTIKEQLKEELESEIIADENKKEKTI